MRSMSPGKNPGGTRQEIHLDITRQNAIDDNAFIGELAMLIENSINIHGEGSADGRLHFGLEDNPRTKVRATARNDKLWMPSAADIAGTIVHPGKDVEHIRATVKYLLVPEAKQATARVIVLGPNWENEPWVDVEENDRPDRWDRPVLLVMPKPLAITNTPAGNHIASLGTWLVEHVPKRRNTVRFLLPTNGTKSIYEDTELLFHARCAYLTAIAWKSDGKYAALRSEFEKPLQNALKTRFDRFAVLRRWNYPQPEQCTFEVEQHKAQGADIAFAVENKLQADLFDPADLETRVLQFAAAGKHVGALLDDLIEPPAAPSVDAIPYLGETAICEQLIQIAAKGSIALNVGGAWITRASTHTNDQEAAGYIRQRAYRTGQELRQIRLGLPGAVGGTAVAGTKQLEEATPAPKPFIVPTPEPVKTISGGPTGLWVTDPEPSPAELPAQPQPKPPSTKRTNEANTGINLSGSFEQWGLAGDKTVQHTRLEFQNLTVSQVKQVLQRIPSSIKAILEVSYREEDDQ
jgi:hypothetical protein